MEEPRTISQEERAAAIAELEESRRRLLETLGGVGAQEAQRRPSLNRWSILECAEHIAAAEIPIPKLLTAATGGEGVEGVAERDEFVRRRLRDRSQADQAPDRLLPKGRWTTLQDARQAFEERRTANIDFVRTTREDLRGRFYPHPFAGMIDCYQWLLFLAAHTDRHAEQIEETKRELKVCG